MAKQARLELWGVRLAALWPQLPEQVRRAVIDQYARLIARVAQAHNKQRGVDR